MKKIILIFVMGLFGCSVPIHGITDFERHSMKLIEPVTVSFVVGDDMVVPAQDLEFFADSYQWKFYKANRTEPSDPHASANGLCINKFESDRFGYWVRYNNQFYLQNRALRNVKYEIVK